MRRHLQFNRIPAGISIVVARTGCAGTSPEDAAVADSNVAISIYPAECWYGLFCFQVEYCRSRGYDVSVVGEEGGD
ncbi:hypothetical protein B0J11DRAFT_518108 [Dendryphion nanum]|uniref:Uncharacterized protein n=1 Tax=Dendryphion nanum TaxID=256645 RepID=A0A9P9IWY8_9PLEO|nr:hypothetical protein B0J11DRAFT_518108 [Dendryphion nanum]